MEVRSDPIDAALARAGDCKERLRLALAELGALRGSVPVEWSDLEAHFQEQEAEARCRASELRVKEQEFEARSRLVLDSVGKRERSVAAREQECPASKTSASFWKTGPQPQQQDEETLDEEDEDDEMEDVKKEAAAGMASTTVPAAAMETDSSSKKLRCSEDHPAGLAKAEVRVRPYLKSLCESMDADGLRRYVVEHRKDFGALRNEMPSALKCAVDPARLVLEAVQGYYSSEPSKEVQPPASKRACILLLEALASVLGTATAGLEYHALVSPELRSLAKDLAEQWRSKVDVQSAPDGSSLDAQAFLQLLATFNLGLEYDEEELCNLVLAVARRKQTPALCRVLNLSHKIPDIVERLTNEAKQIEALQFAHAFDMMDQLQPVQLLKAYLKDARKSPTKTTGDNTNGITNNNHHPQMDSLSKELVALKSVLKCIDDYNLEVEYPPSPLQKRVVLLEKMKSERKRTGGSVKGQAKRPRNGGYDRMNYYGNNRASSDKQHQHQQQQQQHQHQHQHHQQQQQQVFTGVPYSFVPQGFERYSTYGAPAALYSVDGTTVYGSGVYGTQSASFSSYHQLAPLPPPPPGYQPAFLG